MFDPNKPLAADNPTFADPKYWPTYRKTALTPAIHVEDLFFTLGGLEEATGGKGLVVPTKEGNYTLPPDWDGYIAADKDGDLYPIEGEVFRAVYERVDGAALD